MSRSRRENHFGGDTAVLDGGGQGRVVDHGVHPGPVHGADAVALTGRDEDGLHGGLAVFGRFAAFQRGGVAASHNLETAMPPLRVGGFA